MKEIYRNPVFFYVLAAALAAIWPVLTWGVYLPAAKSGLKSDLANCEKAQKTVGDLIKLDAERLKYAEKKGEKTDFDYATAVQGIAELCGIPAANYKLSSGNIVTTSGRKNQSANIALKGVDITQFARFMSAIQLRWANLQCTKVTLKKQKGSPDSWDIDVTFRYYF